MEEEECVYTFIYKTVRAYKRFEDYLQEKLSENKSEDELENEIFAGYLIDYKYIIYWKKFTDYENIKNVIFNKNYRDAKRIIKRHRKNNHLREYQPDTNQIAYYSPQDLYKKIKMKGYQYALIDHNFWKLICYEDVINEEGKMRYFFDENKIIFTFASRGKLEIITDDNILRNSKEMFIKDIHYFQEQYNNDYNEDDDLGLAELKKLILLYAYELEVKNKINNLKYEEKNFKNIFLISKDWIEEYKKYYHYKELTELLSNKQDLKNIVNKGYDNTKKYMPYILSKIALEKRKNKNLFPGILKNENTFLSEGDSIQINNNQINFWKKFEIVNEELKNLFSNSQENEYDFERVSSAKGLITGGKLILDLSNDQNNEGNIALEIGYIGNNDLIFVDEYIFLYDNEEAKNSHLNFFKDKFYLFQKDELNFNMNLKCDLISDEGMKFGTAFKIPSRE